MVEQIANIIADVCETLNTGTIGKTGVQSFCFPLPASDEIDWLEWLAAQPHYPQFYWQHRDGHEEVAACGQIRLFSHAIQAEAFLQQYPQFPYLRIWGLNAWESIPPTRENTAEENTNNGGSYLFLPRMEIRRSRGTIHLYLNVDGQADIEYIHRFLRQIAPHRPFQPSSTAILHATHTPEYKQWNMLLQQALEAISRKKMEKVVLARKTELTLNEPLQAAQFMTASRRVNHHCYHFMLAFSANQAFLASTPERLYFRYQRQLFTEALAGTTENSDDDQQASMLGQWLLNDKKNQHENLLVVDDICQRLQGGVASVDVAPPDVIRLRKVQHLRRPIKGILHQIDDSDCLHRLQPTAAVAGLPREAARQFLAENEPFQRGWYAGSAGYLGTEQSEFAVSLRCASIQGDILSLYAGAGIVSGSNPEQEWAEIENKAAGLRSLLDH
ncbi:MAG: isochorismate synthase MenF [Enterobacteriaceae bacterium]|jgi:menaquinone-specific isochorismate synthase|nr:isochorismate synthase MenF [Enterobacteriaceae bacterium]